MPQTPHEAAAAFFKDSDKSVAFNRLWFNIMRVHRNFYPRIAKDLKKRGVRDLIWHEILWEIERGGAEGRRMSEIEQVLYLPQYALSRHISRMEKEGFLRREYIRDGRRKHVLFLTEKGAGINAEMWPIYQSAIQEELGPLISEEDAYLMSYLLIGILREDENARA
ncbi:MarR family winged helix-turn-helix transcriptional regulator [Celeribacter sp.]|uniref:MarR family winged helix-turn-helix transcriptional regulator n=1 Tax=Celeribacter sp. TaxID=1890673 RepID=UPI003A92999E